MTVRSVRFPDTRLYWFNAPRSPRPFGYLAVGDLGDHAALSDCWLDGGGTFFSLSASIPEATTQMIELALREWLVASDWPTSGQRLLWIAIDGGQIGAITSLAVSAKGNAALMSGPLRLDFGGYVVDVPAGATLAPSPDGAALLLKCPRACSTATAAAS